MNNEQKKIIMIVEDDAFVMDIYRTRLSREGYEIVAAANGAEAVKILEDGKTFPSIILLDIIMPYMDGFDVLKKIKSDEKIKDIPVVLLTNLSQKDDIEKGLGLGASDYIIKSHFTPSEVLEKIKSLIK